MAFTGLVLFLGVAGLLFFLIWLYFACFNRPRRNSGWSKLPEEHIGILGKKQDLHIAPVSTVCADYIKMGYGISEEEPSRRQYLMPVEEVQHQLDVPPPAPVHITEHSEWPALSPTNLRRVMSTESLDSTTSSLMDATEADHPTVHLVLSYHEPSQMLTVQVDRVTDVCDNIGHIWLLFFLLPHPKPLWRTEARTTPASSLDYNCVYQQCIRRGDLSKIALLVQLYCSKQQSASIGGQCRLRLKDVDVVNGNVPVALSLQPQSREKLDETQDLGDVLFMAHFARDSLTVVVSKIRGVDPSYKSVFVRLYVVLPMGKSIKKKTAEQVLAEGAADINESMFFNVSRKHLLQGALRLSVVCSRNGETTKSIGHITLSSKTSGKELGHWTKALSGQQNMTVRWHSLRPRRTHL